jgi:hypothetical protein
MLPDFPLGSGSMEYVLIGVSVWALFMAWRNGRQAKELQERLDSVNDRYFALAHQLRELEEATQQQLIALKIEMKRQAGLLKFEPQMTIAEITEMHPMATTVLASFHLGGCSSCAVSPNQTLAAAAQQHNINLPLLLGALKQLAEGQAPSAPSKSQLQTDPDLRIIA